MLSLHSDLKRNDGLELNLILILMNVKHAPRGIYFASFLSISPNFNHNPLFYRISNILFETHICYSFSYSKREKRQELSNLIHGVN